MPDSLEIHEISTLSDLRGSLSRFADKVQQALASAEVSIGETLEWLDERSRHWQREAEGAHNMERQAEARLERCEASGFYDHDGCYRHPDCSREQAELRQAKEHLLMCREHLQTAQAWRSKVCQGVDAYHRDVRPLRGIAQNHTERALAELRSLSHKYEAVHQQQTTTGMAGGLVGGAIAGTGTAPDAWRGSGKQGIVGVDDLRAGTKYQRGTYEFRTDGQGNPKSVYANLELKPAERAGEAQKEVGKRGRPTDEGGHLIAVRFNGPSDAYNLVPQDANLNRGAWKTMEKHWADALRRGHQVQVMIDLVRQSQEMRPVAFQVVYQIDMEDPQYVFFRNRSGKPAERKIPDV